MNFLCVYVSAVSSRLAWVLKWRTVCLHIMLFYRRHLPTDHPSASDNQRGTVVSCGKTMVNCFCAEASRILVRELLLLIHTHEPGRRRRIERKRDKKTETLQCFGGKRTRFFACSKKTWWMILSLALGLHAWHGEHSIQGLLLMHVSRLLWHETQLRAYSAAE